MKTTLTRMGQLIVLVVFATMWAAPSGAQPASDHLRCYKVRDPQPKTTYSADLGGLVADVGCTIKVPAVLVCVPSSKTNVTPQPPGSGGSETPNAFGCYKIKCPKGATLPAIPLNDQFGNRTVTPKVSKLLCAPSAEAAATTTTSTTTTTTTSSTIAGNCRTCWLSVSDLCTSKPCTNDTDCQVEPNLFCLPDRCQVACP